MKNLLILMGMLIAGVMVAGCSSGIDGSRTVGLESATGMTIADGASISPDDEIEVKFAIAPGQVLAAMICYEGDEDTAGEIVDLTIIPIDALNVRIVPTSGYYPQMKRCELAISAFGEYYSYTLNTECSMSDYFTNSNTFDLTANASEYGSGCWKTNKTGTLEILADVLMIGGLNDPDNWVTPNLYKRAIGDEYVATMNISDVVYEFTEGLDDKETLSCYVVIARDLEGILEGSPYTISGYQVRWDNDLAAVQFRCATTSSVVGQTVVENCGDGSIFPQVGLIKNGTQYTPYYSFDEGVTRTFYNLAVGDSSYDMSTVLSSDEELDVGILILGHKVGVLGTVFVSSVVVSGDAVFVE